MMRAGPCNWLWILQWLHYPLKIKSIIITKATTKCSVYSWALESTGSSSRISHFFYFWSSKSPLKALPYRDCSLVKPLLFPPRQPAIFLYHGPFCLYIQQPLGISPALPWQNFGQSPAHFHGYPRPSTRCMGGWGLQMTNALVVKGLVRNNGKQLRLGTHEARNEILENGIIFFFFFRKFNQIL